MSLARCIEKLPLDHDDIVELYIRIGHYESEGVKDAEARAVDDMLSEAMEEYKDIVSQIEKQGGVVGERGYRPEKTETLYQSNTDVPIVKISSADLGREPTFETAKKYFKAQLQGTTLIRKEIGNVRVTGKGWHKVKRGLKTDPLKVTLLQAVPGLIEKGEYHGREKVERSDDIAAFHYFSGYVNVDGTIVQAGVTVGEDSFGNFFYNINHDADKLWEKRKARQLLPRLEARGAGEPSGGQDKPDTLRQSIGKDGFPINITILGSEKISDINDVDRGTITFTGVESIIKLTERSNLATFLHEAGHLFLETEAKLSEAYGALEDQQALFQWLGVDSFDQVGKDHHEQFARGFEAYLREGKAPSIELRDIFAAFRQWLIRIYQSIRSLDVEINDEVRQYMDRLLATEEEIERAMANPAYDQFFRSKEQAGMTDKQWEEYQKRQTRAKNKATQTIDEKLLTELRKRRSKEWKEEKAPLIEEEKERLSQEPKYQLLADIKNKPMEYDLVKEIMHGVSGGLLSKTKKGGVNPDVYAGAYGFTSTKAMLEEILITPPLNQAADTAAEERMIGKHGDILNDGSLEEEVRQAVHNEAQASLMFEEIRALNKRAGGKQAIDREYLKGHVKNLVSQMTREDLKPGKYYYAEIKAAKRAVQTTDPDEQLEAKIQQIINHYLFREITEAKQNLEKWRKYIRQVQTREYKAIDVAPAYSQNMKVLANLYEMRRSPEITTSDIEMLLAWHAAQLNDEHQLVDLQLYDLNLLKALEAKERDKLVFYQPPTYDEMTMEQVESVYTMLRHLRFVGGKMADAAREVFRLKAISAGDSIRNNAIRGPKQGERGTTKGKLKKAVHEYGANVLLHADSVLRRLDGFKDGLMYQLIKRPIDDAITQKLMPAEEKAGEEMDEIYHRFYKDSEMRKMNKKEDFEGLSLSKWERISLVLNYGNESSREAVHDSTIDGVKPFTKVMMGKIIDSLDKNDMDFIQAVWDNIEQHKPALFGLERKLNGVAPPSVEPMPLQTKHGVYKGGYYPLMYDRKASLVIQESEYNEMSKAMTAGRAGQAHTKDGMTKERVGSGGNPIRLDMMVWHQHVHDVLRRIHLTEAVNQAQSIIASSAVRNAAVETSNQELITALDVWIKDTAAGELMPVDIASRVLRGIRSGFSVSVIGLNFGTILMQPLGLLQTMPVIGYRNTLKGLVALSAHPIKVIKEVQSLSPFMHNRGKTFNKDIYDTLRTLHGDPNKPSFIPSAVRKSYFAGIVYVQRYVDAITWLGAYEATKQNTDKQEDLIHAADRAVARSQASGVWSDRTPIERGSLSPGLRQAEFVKLFTALGSYFFAKGNVAMELFGKTDFRNPAAIARYITDMMLLFAVEAILVGLIRGTWPDEDDEESKAAYIAKEIGLSTLGAFPLLREIGSEIQGFRGGSTAASFYEAIGNAATQIGQGEIDSALVKSINKLGGIAFKYPSSATNRAFDSLVKDIQGEDVAPIDYLMYREKD
ncbi:MAG: hypothetical protein AB2777_21180 [Candidatus Thiodiazotropha endolucinida]